MYNRDTLIEQSLNCSRAHTFNYPQCASGYWLVMLYYLQESEVAKVAVCYLADILKLIYTLIEQSLTLNSFKLL